MSQCNFHQDPLLYRGLFSRLARFPPPLSAYMCCGAYLQFVNLITRPKGGQR